MFALLPILTVPARQHHDGLIKNPPSLTAKQTETARVGRYKPKGQIEKKEQ